MDLGKLGGAWRSVGVGSLPAGPGERREVLVLQGLSGAERDGECWVPTETHQARSLVEAGAQL